MKIESGVGNGYYAAVDEENRLRVAAVSLPRQHNVAKVYQKNFQLNGTASIASGTENVLFLKNDTSDQTYTVTYIRVSAITSATLPATTEYFEVAGGLEYSSGGTAINPANTYIGSTKIDGGSHYEDNPTLTGTATVLDRHYLKTSGDEYSYSKEGALIIPPGQTLTIRYTGTGTGEAYARISYFVTPVNSLDI